MAGNSELQQRLNTVSTILLAAQTPTTPVRDRLIFETRTTVNGVLKDFTTSTTAVKLAALDTVLQNISGYCTSNNTDNLCVTIPILEEARYQVEQGLTTGVVPSLPPGKRVTTQATALAVTPLSKPPVGDDYSVPEQLAYIAGAIPVAIGNINLLDAGVLNTSPQKPLYAEAIDGLTKAQAAVQEASSAYTIGTAGTNEARAAIERALDQLTIARTAANNACTAGQDNKLCLQGQDIVTVRDTVRGIEAALVREAGVQSPAVVPAAPGPGQSQGLGVDTSRSDTVKAETWGVKFSHLLEGGFATVEYAWFLALLPAMRSSVPLQGGMDTPNAMPGLAFKIVPNVAKHKIVGFQPAFQHLGIDTIAVSIVGTFTGVDGELPQATFFNEPQKYYNTFTTDSKFLEPEPSLLGSKYASAGEITSAFDSYRDMQSFYKFAVMAGRELTVEINIARNTKYKDTKAFNEVLDPTNNVNPLRDPSTGNPKFKAVVKRMEAYHARQDRTWYVIDLEVTDAGLRSNTAIDLTNDIAPEIANAVAATGGNTSAQPGEVPPSVVQPEVPAPGRPQNAAEVAGRITDFNVAIQNVLTRQAPIDSLKAFATPDVIAKVQQRLSQIDTEGKLYKYGLDDGTITNNTFANLNTNDIKFYVDIKRNYDVLNQSTQTAAEPTINQVVSYQYVFKPDPKTGTWLISGVEP